MAERDFTHLTPDEKINGIKASKLPDHIRSKYHGEDVREALAQSTEMAIQLGINMGLSPDDAISWARKLQEAIPRSEFDSWVATLLDGGPSIFMNTLAELKTTYPNGAAGVALVRETDPAKIYVWNGSAWEDFGDYQGVEIADGSITAKKLANSTINLSKLSFSKIDSQNVFDLESAEVGGLREDGTVDNGSTTFYTSDFMRFNPNDVVNANFNLQSSAIYDISMNVVSVTFGTVHSQFVMPSNGYYAKVTRYNSRMDEFMVVSGPLPATYKPFKRVVSGDIIEDDTISLGKLDFVSQGKNLFNPEEVIKGKYVNPTSGVLQSNPAYDTTIIKEASPNEKYTITYPRFVVFYGLDNKIIPSESITFDVPPESHTITLPSNAYGYRFSFPTINKIQIEKGDVATYYEPYMQVIDDVSVRSSNIIKYGDRVTKSTSKGDLTNGQRLVSGKSNSIKKNKSYSFSSKITSFYGLRMGQGETDYGGSYIEITASELKFFDYRTAVTPRNVLTHGLTISNFIDVLITIDKDAKAIVRIITDGGFYESTPQNWEGYNGTPFAKSMGSTLTDGEFVFDTSDFDKPIYFFGDSYAGLTAKDRWVNYIREWGFDNWFINAYPGQASLSAKGMLDFALSKGNPEILIWGLGMNDGDSSTAVDEDWLTTYNKIEAICESRDIELVLCTIPNVPSINNSFKNEIIRDSGHRYIDFAKAVGAEEVGSNWYTGMLSGDKVHPSILGAQKLALRAIEDVPELSGKANKKQEAWITPALLHGATGTVQYRKTETGRVEFRGTLRSNTGDSLFVLPTGYKPSDDCIFIAPLSNHLDDTTRRFLIKSNGAFFGGVTYGDFEFNLNGLSFPVD